MRAHANGGSSIRRLTVRLATTRENAVSLSSACVRWFRGPSAERLDKLFEQLSPADGGVCRIERLTIDLGSIVPQDFDASFTQRLLARLEEALRFHVAASFVATPRATFIDAAAKERLASADADGLIREHRDDLDALTHAQCERLAHACLRRGAAPVVLAMLDDAERYVLCRRMQKAALAGTRRVLPQTALTRRATLPHAAPTRHPSPPVPVGEADVLPVPGTSTPQLPLPVAQALVTIAALIVIGGGASGDAPAYAGQPVPVPRERRASAWLTALLAMPERPLPEWSRWRRALAAQPLALTQRPLARRPAYDTDASAPRSSEPTQPLDAARAPRVHEQSRQGPVRRAADEFTRPEPPLWRRASEPPAFDDEQPTPFAAAQPSTESARDDAAGLRSPSGETAPPGEGGPRRPAAAAQSSADRRAPSPSARVRPASPDPMPAPRQAAGRSPQARAHAADPFDYFDVANAGIVLLWPLLPELFASLGLLDARDPARATDFIDAPARERAAGWLDELIWPDAEADTERRAFTRLLCGLPLLPLDEPDHEDERPNDRPNYRPNDRDANDDQDHAHAATRNPPDPLRGRIDAWYDALPGRIDGLRRCTPADLRALFLQRPGTLLRYPRYDELAVSFHAADFLLAKLPWPLTQVPWAWLERPLSVRWPIPRLDDVQETPQ